MKKRLLALTLICTSCTTTTNIVQSNPNTPTPTPSSIQSPVTSASPTITDVVASPTAIPTPEPLKFDIQKEYKVNMETSLGTIKLKLYNQEAPKTVENFVRLIDKKFYDGVIFHRVIPGFMIQGGDPTGGGNGGESIYGNDFEDEFSPNLKFTKKGILAMANRGVNTNTSQFFITVDSFNYPFAQLNNKHTIFGEVIEGFDTIEKIATTNKGEKDRPTTPVVMTKVTLY